MCVTRGTESHWIHAYAGVPQGAVLACLLFICYINDLLMVATFVRALLAADDLSLVPKIIGFEAVRHLVEAMNQVDLWSAKWRMTLAPAKSAVVLFGRAYRPRSIAFTFLLRNQVVPVVSEVKYLGIWLDAALCFKRQFAEKIAQAKRLVGMTVHRIGRACAGRPVPIKIVRAIAVSLIMATVYYGSEFWLVGNRRAQKQLDAQVSRVLNLALRLPVRSHICLLVLCWMSVVPLLGLQLSSARYH